MDYTLSLYQVMANTNTNSTTDHQKPQEPNAGAQLGTIEGQRGRKPGGGGGGNKSGSNVQAKKSKTKIQRRGMGVEQLEKLRTQEMLKSMAESSSSCKMDPSLATRVQVANLLGLPPPQATQFQYPHGCYYGVPVVGSGGGAKSGSGNGHGMVVKLDQQGRRASNGYGHDHDHHDQTIRVLGGGGGGGSGNIGNGMVVGLEQRGSMGGNVYGHDHHQANRALLGGGVGLGSDRTVVSQFGSCSVGGGPLPGFGASRELSSMPNKMTTTSLYQPQQHYQHHHNAGFQCCDVCLKLQKMKFEEEKRRHCGRRENFGQTSSGYGYGYELINQQSNTLFNGDIGGFSARAARSAFYANQMTNQGVEPVGTNSSAGGSGGTLMEYEFFPGKRGKRNHPKEDGFASGGASAIAGGGGGSGDHQTSSCVTTSENNYSGYLGASNNASTSYIDLSLKLSC